MTAVSCYFLTAPRGVEPLLADELIHLGASAVRATQGGVHCEGPLVVAYRAALWSRTASRVLLPLAEIPASDSDVLYEAAHKLPWEDHLSPDGTLWVDCTIRHGPIQHSRFASQRLKDAVVDRLRERFGRRPSVDRQPDLRLNLHIHGEHATVSIDLAGDALHRRGYRQQSVTAPLKENLAAALLIKAGWPALAAEGCPLLDPLCGSGSFPIEAAWIAADHAPGLLRAHWGFSGWLNHDADCWQTLLNEAQQRAVAGLKRLPIIQGQDRDSKAITAARHNAVVAGVGGQLRLLHQDLSTCRPMGNRTGLVIANPPYGERLSDPGLQQLYADLGTTLKSHFGGWQLTLFTGNPELAFETGLRAKRNNVFYNGALRCQLLQFPLTAEHAVDREAQVQRRHQAKLQSGADFANRLRKNLRTIGKRMQREGMGCYRLYDADIPEYAVAVDRYDDWLVVQEYTPPPSVDDDHAEAHLQEVMVALQEILDIPLRRIALKSRRRQRPREQYQRQDSSDELITVNEDAAQFLINPRDYLDTGLFLDHRLSRRLLRDMAADKTFLNLYAYTATATVAAALGGAKATTSVDLSNTYLRWADRNLALNNVRDAELIRADVGPWLHRCREHFDLIFLDPPTYSNSKAMQGDLDVQRDHPTLIDAAVKRLNRDGVLLFTTHKRDFELHLDIIRRHHVDEITKKTTPVDFARSQPHRSFLIRGRD